MKKLLLISLFFAFSLFSPLSIMAAESQALEQPGFHKITALSLGLGITGFKGDCGDIASDVNQNLIAYSAGRCNSEGEMAGLIPTTANYVAELYHFQPSGEEYVADILNNIGVPSISRAYAQGTGYKAMSPFLEFWKVFRNLAYSLYIIMFVVVGIMIMLRTKVNAQTIITIQTALPNLLITLLLITFSYAIVGFMIDIMYFLIYFITYLFSSIGVLDGAKAVDRLMTNNAWGIIFDGRNSIISAIADAMVQVLGGNSGGGLAARVVGGVLTTGISELAVQAIPYLLVAVWLAITMLKLVFVLTQSYVMLIIQTVTAPVQILMNAIPGSKAFSEWIKKTASYLIPFPVAAAMFIVAAMFVKNPTNNTLLNGLDPRDANPFGIVESGSTFYENWNNNDVWTPPFTFDLKWESSQIMILIGFFIFAMTPAAVKMAQDWLQVKASPYTSEAFGAVGVASGTYKWYKGKRQELENKKLFDAQMENYNKR